MVTFREFLLRKLNESDDQEVASNVTFDDIVEILETMTEDEINDFGFYLYAEFFASDDEDEDELALLYFTIDDVKAMIVELGEDFYQTIYDLLQPEDDEEGNDEDDYEDDEDEDEDDDEVFESVSRRMDVSNMNKSPRKYMKLSWAKFRQLAQERKRKTRETKQYRKRYYRANRAKILAYMKSYRQAVKSGKHKPKKRLGAKPKK